MARSTLPWPRQPYQTYCRPCSAGPGISSSAAMQRQAGPSSIARAGPVLRRSAATAQNEAAR
eukprot:7901336-Pyramimonas_sp.AAC.1